MLSCWSRSLLLSAGQLELSTAEDAKAQLMREIREMREGKDEL